MFNFLVEAVVVSFALGGVVGVVVTLHLSNPKKAAEKASQEAMEP
ncbi:MAG: hypothetical protein AABZ84_02420 [Pseudomonadota bacterium]